VAAQEQAQIDRIIVDARRHLAEALSHLSPNQPSYDSGWQPQVEAMRRDIPSLSDAASCLHYAQYHITFDGRHPFPGDQMLIQFREWAVANEFPQFESALRQFSESPLSGPAEPRPIQRKNRQHRLYYHARNVLAGVTYANKPQRILEIGGGYGEIARVWVTNPVAPVESYVVVDIPESLFFAEVALKTEFGEKVGYFDRRDPGTLILLGPLPYLRALTRSADLVVNTGSMQEMTDEWIDFYMQ
jgi:putative sugar O-methyltransferase